MKLFHFLFIAGVDQMIFSEGHLWGIAFAISTNICLTKDWNQNIIGALMTASIRKIIRKIYKIKKAFKKVFDQCTNSGL